MNGSETYEDVDYDEAPPASQNALALQPSRLPMSPSIAKEFDIDAPTWRVLVEQTFPSAKTIEAVLMALSYCRARKLDIFKKPVHIVPMWSSAKRAMVETVWPGIAEIRTTAARTGEYVGIDAVEFGPMIEREFIGDLEQWENRKKVTKTVTKKVRYPEWASVTVYRFTKGNRYAYHAKVFWEETYAKMGRTEIPNEMWEKRARGQLDKCVEAAALRKAFPEEVGSMYAAEEMEGRVIDGAATAVIEPPSPPTPPSPPPAPSGKEPAPTPPAAQTTSGGEPGDKAASAGDFNDDDSGVSQPVDLDAFLVHAGEEIGDLDDEGSVVEKWEGLRIEATIIDHTDEGPQREALLDKAAGIRKHRIATVTGTGDLLGDDGDFPGDRPMPKSTP